MLQALSRVGVVVRDVQRYFLRRDSLQARCQCSAGIVHDKHVHDGVTLTRPGVCVKGSLQKRYMGASG